MLLFVQSAKFKHCLLVLKSLYARCFHQVLKMFICKIKPILIPLSPVLKLMFFAGENNEAPITLKYILELREYKQNDTGGENHTQNDQKCRRGIFFFFSFFKQNVICIDANRRQCNALFCQSAQLSLHSMSIF